MSNDGSSNGDGVAETVSLREIILAFLEEHRFLHEYRLQKLVYLAELLSIKNSGQRLTNAEFKPYMYGAYSKDVSKALEDLESEAEVPTFVDSRHGKVTKAFKGRGEKTDLDEGTLSIVDSVVNITRRKSNEELADWSKSTWLFENTPYGDNMDMLKYETNFTDKLEEDLEDLLQAR